MAFKTYSRGDASDPSAATSPASVSPPAGAGGGFKTYSRAPKQAAASGEGLLTNVGSAGLATASGVTTGIDTLGSLIEVMPGGTAIGDAIRTTGLSGTQWLQSKMSPSWQEAVNKNWATLDWKNAAYKDPKAWAAAILQQLPYMVGTLGAGNVVKGGLEAAGMAAEKAAVRGHVAVQAGAGAGEAASGAAQATDEAGKTPEERATAMRTAAAIGAPAGAVLGKTLGHVLGEGAGSLAKRAAVSATGEVVEEGGTQVGTETGKTTAGLPFDWSAVGEAAVAGGAIGLPVGAVISRGQVKREKRAAEDKLVKDQQTAQMDAAEKAALAQEQELQRTKLANANVGVDALPPGVVAPSTAAPARPATPAGIGRPPPQPLTPEGPFTAQINALEEKLSKLIPPGEIKAEPQKQGSKGKVKFKLTTTEQTQRAKAASIYKSTRDQINFLRKRNEEALAAQGSAVETTTTEQRPVPNVWQGAQPGTPVPEQQTVGVPVTTRRNIGQAHTIEETQGQQLLPMMLLQKSDPAVREQAETEAFDALFDDNGEVLPKQSGTRPVHGPLTPTPLETAINTSIKRSQAAQKGLETKRAKKAAANPAPQQAAAPSMRGSAESTAILARTGPIKPPVVGPQQAATMPPPAPPQADPNLDTGVKVAPPVGPVAPLAPTRKRGVVQAPTQLPITPEALPPQVQSEPEPPSPAKQTAAEFLAYRKEAERKLRQTAQPKAAADAVEISRSRSKPKSAPTQAVAPEPSPAPAVETPVPTPPKTPGQMTPRERLAHVLQDGPQPLDTVLAAMQDAYSAQGQPNTYTLIERLRRALPNSKSSPIKLKVFNTTLSNGFQGMYMPKDDVILLDLAQAENAPQAFLHEAVHAATIIAMRTNSVVRERIERIMQDARETWAALKWQPDVGEIQAFSSPEEFIATVLTDTEFHDTLQNLPAKDVDSSVFRKLAVMIGRMFGMQQNPKTYELFHTLLEFVPDGAFLQAPERQAVLASMDRLGLTDPVASLLSTFRSYLRGRAVAVPAGLPPRDDRSWMRKKWLKTLWAYTPEQVARTYGYLGKSYTDINDQQVALPHDVINQHYALVDGREAFAEMKRVVSTKVAGYAEGAIDPVRGSQAFDDIIVNSRMWALDPSKPVGDPINAFGLAQPGGAQLYADLATQWSTLNQVQKNSFELFRDSYRAAYEDEVNGLTINIVRTTLGEAEAARVKAYIDDPARQVTSLVVTDIPISYQRALDPSDVGTLLHTVYGPPTSKTHFLMKQLNAIQDVLGKSQGPYFPLRREGNYFAIVRSPEVVATMSDAALEKMVLDDRRLPNGGALNISKIKKLTGAQKGQNEVTYKHEVVSAHDTEQDADDAVATYEADFKSRSTPIPIEYGARHLKKDVLYEGTGLKSASLDLLKQAVKKAIPGAAGDAAAEQITKFYIERLPDTSAKKSQLRARKVQGASRDMLHVYANFMQGISYHQAQMEFGHQIASNLTTKADEVVKTLREARASGKADRRALDQADDITAIMNSLKGNDAKYNSLAAAQQRSEASLVMSLWQRVPQLAGAWLLTGPGTIITNGFQPAVITLPHLGARHGFGNAASALKSAYGDVLMPATKAAGKEFGSTVTKFIPSVKNIARGRQGISGKDPANPFYRQATQNLDASEKRMIEALVNAKKLDYGVAADLQTLKSRQGIGWNAVTYMTNAAFIMPQAVETLNRTVTAVASYRLNKAANPNMTEEELTAIAARDVDQTQFNYNQSNKAGYAQNEGLRAALVFKTYAQAMTYTIGHNLVQAFDKNNPKERAIARKFIGGLAASTFLTCGLVGIVAWEPFYWTFVALLALFGDDDDDLDPEQAMRQAMSGWNEDVVAMMTKGFFHATGMADTSRMALPQFFNASDMVRNFQGTSDDWLASLGGALVGAPGSTLEQIGAAAGHFGSGDYAKGIVAMTPKAFMLNDFARAGAYLYEGVKTSAGYTAMDAGDVTLRDVVTRVLGFEPPGISDAKGATRSFYRRDERLRGTQQDLLKRFGQASLSHNDAARDKALDDIRAFNKKYPRSRITKQSLSQSLKGRLRTQKNVARYGVNAATPGQRELVRDIATGYGGEE